MLFELSVRERMLIIFSLTVTSNVCDKAGGGDDIDGAILGIIAELDPEGKITETLSDMADKMTSHAESTEKEKEDESEEDKRHPREKRSA